MLDILKRKEGLMLKLGQLIGYQIKKKFLEKVCRKCAPKASLRSNFNFGKKPKRA